jgi:hypothetical protein
LGGVTFISFGLDLEHVLARAPIPCVGNRNTCVSTAMVSSPNATFITTFAVLRPTPGSASKASRVFGTWPPCCSSSRLESAITFFAFPR